MSSSCLTLTVCTTLRDCPGLRLVMLPPSVMSFHPSRAPGFFTRCPFSGMKTVRSVLLTNLISRSFVCVCPNAMSVLPWVVGVVKQDDPSRRTEVGDLRADLARSLSVAAAGGPALATITIAMLVRTKVLVEHEEA